MKNILTSQNKLNSYDKLTNSLLIFALLITASIYVKLTLTVFNHPYLPAYSDEIGYYLGSLNFYLNTSLSTPITLYGSLSKIFELGFHGFMYELIHGIIAKAIGFHAYNMIITNIVITIISLIIIFNQKISLQNKLTLSLLLLLYFLFPMYMFTYMQEIINAGFAVIASVLLIRIYQSFETQQTSANITGNIILFLSVLLIAALVRPTWLIWSVGLIPLAKSRIDFYKYFGIVLICGIISILIEYLFIAPYPLGIIANAQTVLSSKGLLSALLILLKHCQFNLGQYFIYDKGPFPYYFWTKYIIFFLIVYSSIVALIKRNRLYIAVALIGISYFVILAVLYDLFAYRELRGLTSIYILCVFTLIMTNKRVAALSTLLALTLLLPGVLKQTQQTIYQHIETAEIYQQSYKERVILQKDISNLSPPHHRITILLPSDFIKNGWGAYLNLPLRTHSGYPIRYDIELNTANKKDDLKHDYILKLTSNNSKNSPFKAYELIKINHHIKDM